MRDPCSPECLPTGIICRTNVFPQKAPPLGQELPATPFPVLPLAQLCPSACPTPPRRPRLQAVGSATSGTGNRAHKGPEVPRPRSGCPPPGDLRVSLRGTEGQALLWGGAPRREAACLLWVPAPRTAGAGRLGSVSVPACAGRAAACGWAWWPLGWPPDRDHTDLLGVRMKGRWPGWTLFLHVCACLLPGKESSRLRSSPSMPSAPSP